MINHNAEWTTPGGGPDHSVPLGNGEIGLNVWAEENGDLLFYISKSDAWNENARLLKLGKVRIAFDPVPWQAGASFRQTLHVDTGELEITADWPPEETWGGQDRGAGGKIFAEDRKAAYTQLSQIRLRLWVDANRPVIRLQGASNREVSLSVSLEMWRNRERIVTGTELSNGNCETGFNPDSLVEDPDTIVQDKPGRIMWYHRNVRSVWPDNLRLQGLEGLPNAGEDPLMHHTFGGLIVGDGLVSDGPQRLQSAQPLRQFAVEIYPFARQTAAAAEWIELLEREAAVHGTISPQHSLEAHREWWRQFWQRSYIRIDGCEEAEIVTRGYVLQRYMNACAGRGGYPIKFNGSLFTFETKYADEHFTESFDADYRRWGGAYWFQNTRLSYWPMLGSGDFEMMLPLFRMYSHALPLALDRTKLYFGHEGAFFPETMHFWGTYLSSNYGPDRQGKPVSHVDNGYIRYYWQGGLELVALMLEYFVYTEDSAAAASMLLPMADAVLTFYDRHYARDDAGKLLISPASALETWHEAVNPLPEIAGLGYVLRRLLDLPAEVTGEERRAEWQRLLDELPTLPVRREDDENGNERFVLLAAQQLIGPIMNMENPELYAIFPYSLYAVGKPDLELARSTFAARRIKRTGGWFQDAIQAACLGLTDDARRDVVFNFSTSYSQSRFPAFWGPNFDWVPDQDHGNVAVMALQTMLMQNDGRKIRLFPAWPKQWDVDFKLNAPFNTTLEGSYRSGRLHALKVTPEARAADVVLMINDEEQDLSPTVRSGQDSPEVIHGRSGESIC